MSSASLHHVAFACKDPEATRHFYEDLMGFPLVHTEVAPVEKGFIRHFFFALDDGSCLDSADVSLPVYATRVTAEGDVQVGSRTPRFDVIGS